jgi:uncharacterized protein YbjT (DUF2867 family)
MRVLVTGAGGLLGDRVLRLALEAGHEVGAATHTADRRFPDEARPVVMDLATGAGLEGIEAVIHCASDFRNHHSVDAEGTRRLVEASRPDTHFIYPGIVGSDVIPLKYYHSKMEAEAALLQRPWTVIRTTQFHHLGWALMARQCKRMLMPVPTRTRIQPLDPESLAVRLVEAVAAGERGRAPDLGGRFVYDVSDLARSYLEATGKKRWVVRFNWPGLVGASLRAGANITPNRDEQGETWNEFVARQPG